MEAVKRCPRCDQRHPRTSEYWHIGPRGNITVGLCRTCRREHNRQWMRESRGSTRHVSVMQRIAYYAALELAPYCACGWRLWYSVDRLGRLVETCQRCDTVSLTPHRMGNPLLPNVQHVEVACG